MAASIHVSNARIRRGDFTLEVKDLEIAPREIFAVLGKTGSGKTVFMESIMGAYPLESGEIEQDGRSISALPLQKRRLGVLYQDHALFEHLSVFDNVAYGLARQRIPKGERARRVNAMLELFDISHLAERFPGTISGGEAQRVAFARALVLNPEILILDEPFSALDPMTKYQMYDLLRAVHRKFSCTILFVTHDFSEAKALADRVGIILEGRLRCVVDADKLFEHHHDSEVRQFLGLDRASS